MNCQSIVMEHTTGDSFCEMRSQNPSLRTMSMNRNDLYKSGVQRSIVGQFILKDGTSVTVIHRSPFLEACLSAVRDNKWNILF